MRVLIITGFIATTISFNTISATITQAMPEPLPSMQKNTGLIHASKASSSPLAKNLPHEVKLNLTKLKVSDAVPPKISLLNLTDKKNYPLLSLFSKFSIHHFIAQLKTAVINSIKHIHIPAFVWLFGSLLVGMLGLLNANRKQNVPRPDSLNP